MPNNAQRSSIRETIEQMRGVMTTAEVVESKQAADVAGGADRVAPLNIPTVFDIKQRTELLTQHAKRNGAGHRFLTASDDSDTWYSRDLVGIPFVVVSEPIYRTEKAPWGTEEVALLQVRLFNWQTQEQSESKQVKFNGRWLLGKLKRMTANELVGSYVWTVARNPDKPLTPQGVHPYMLAAYDPEQDKPPVDDVPF